MDNVLVKVNETEMQIKEWRGQRVVTFADIDTVHERPKGTAKRNFVANKKHFIQYEDYVVIKPCDLKNSQKNEIRTSGINKVNPRGTTYFTETGYLMLVKSFTDDLSWDVQRTLVKIK